MRQVAALDYTWEAREGMIRKEEYKEGYKAGEIEEEKRGEADLCADEIYDSNDNYQKSGDLSGSWDGTRVCNS